MFSDLIFFNFFKELLSLAIKVKFLFFEYTWRLFFNSKSPRTSLEKYTDCGNDKILVFLNDLIIFLLSLSALGYRLPTFPPHVLKLNLHYLYSL